MKVQDIPSEVKFYNHRGRLVHLIPPGTEERSVGERVLQLREQGVTYREISDGTGLSISTIHRIVARMLLTLEVERGERDRELKAMMPKSRAGTSRVRKASSSTSGIKARLG